MHLAVKQAGTFSLSIKHMPESLTNHLNEYIIKKIGLYQEIS